MLARLRGLTARDVALYPEREPGERQVADFLGVQPNQVLLTNGIDEGLYLLTATYLGSGDEMLFADPTFVMYAICGRAAGGHLVRVQADEDLAFPAGKLLASISPRTRLITIANPNNPTGMIAARADLLHIIEAAPDAAVLVDEAYFEFGGETLLPELPRYPNLFIARTFSKAYGLAGLRLGALIGAPEQIGYIRRFSAPFNVNAVALACLEEALADQAFVGEYVAQMKQGREQLARLCAELGLRTWPSSTNFVLVRVAGRRSVRCRHGAAGHRGAQYVGEPRLRRMRANHGGNEGADGRRHASHARSAGGKPGLTPGRPSTMTASSVSHGSRRFCPAPRK